MIRWKGIGSQRLLWVFVTLLAIGCLAAAAVAGAIYYRSADHIDLTIDLIPEEGYMVQRYVPLDPAQARTVALGAPAMGSGWTTTPPMMRQGSRENPIYVDDQYGHVWMTETQVEIFKSTYENDQQQVSVAGKNGDKVIAPGTSNDYTFSLNNITGTFVDYKLVLSAFVTGADELDTFPVEVRVKGINGWVVGSEDGWLPVLEMNGMEDTAVTESRLAAMYTLEWRWPFESGQDELDTWLGNQEQDVTLTIKIETIASYHPYDDDEDDLEVDGPSGEGGGNSGEVPTPPPVPPITEPVPDHLRPADRGRHLAYIYGYEDGTLRPEANITRAEVAAIFYRLTNEAFRAHYETTECTYPDVPAAAWFRCEVATMTAMGVLKGYPDGLFRPNEPITRAELTAIVSRFAEQSWKAGSKTAFVDIDGHWANAEIRSVEDKNWIIGYPDGTFRPDSLITRGEAVTIVNRMLHRLPEQFEDLLDNMPTWRDNRDLSKWYYIAMQEAAVSHTCEYLIGTREQWIALLEEVPEQP